MKTITTAVMVCAAGATTAWGAPPEGVPDRPGRVSGALEPLNYYVGDWTLSATWAWGMTIDARNEYRVGVGGKFVEVITVASDGGGEAYERYHSFYTPERDGDAYIATGFTYDGTTSTIPYAFEVEDGLPTIHTDTANPDGSRLRQEMDPLDADSVAWRVWMTAPGADQEQQIMDGVWHRVVDEESAMGDADAEAWASANAEMHSGPYDVRAGHFDAAGAGVRSFEKTAEIAAPVSDVFRAWSDGDAWKEVYGPERAEMVANIDLAIGGRYEWLFDGATGGNGCQVLSYIPDRMITFSWNAPPAQPESRAKRTWVVVELEPLAGERTKITLTHLGFGDASHWDETHDYFDIAWDRVLGAMQQGLARKG
ncbi:MAG: hypothetical protein DHS20C14_06250 [Phycisphaeraceae bacterium]|nr:MAG: hypothetical protein DHS20C14_06250 [Phycisphaeraceae bacterium]